MSSPEVCFHFGKRFQKFAFSVTVFIEYVWTGGKNGKKLLRFQTKRIRADRALVVSAMAKGYSRFM